MEGRKLALWIAGGAILLFVASQDGLKAQAGEAVQRVFVVNQPETLRIRGEVTIAEPIVGQVSVTGPIPQGRALVIKDVEVPPVSKATAPNLVFGGTVNTEGFVNMVVSLAGMQRATPTRSGEVGVILLPEEELPQRAWEEHGEALFAVVTSGQSKTGSPPYFASEPLRATVAFPRYRVFLYNNSDRTVLLTVYVYLSG
ncbi:MAG: hypothetical protein ACUVRY_10205 [Thermoanaerobaculaceae bacterium]